MMKKALLAISALALLGATQAEEPERNPGEQVLCIGAFLYLAQLQAETCHAGKDPEYQARLKSYRDRLDAYLIRNFPNGEADLVRFKERQGLSSPAEKRICNLGKDYDFYGHWRELEAEKVDGMVDSLLERDGPPTFGDCV